MTLNLPPQPTAFVGRVSERAEIAALLADPACRLLTLVGPGGVGKTRLAIQAAAEAKSLFPDGAWFAALQPVSSTEHLVPALADALNLKFYGSEPPRAQLLHRLQPKTLLLVVDNFEHLLDDVALLSEILAAAPGVKLLVTSRETLNVREEWVRVVEPMAVPADDRLHDAEHYDAVRLFVERARQARGDFDPGQERPHIIRICQLVEGLPLAIELAAAQTRTASCARIAQEIQHSMGVLATSLRNVPERHRDLYALFEPCWSRLTPAQRAAFTALSVFRGGFEREAAEVVAGASPPMLTALADKSLLRVTPTGRYAMHELVRQYAEARLLERPGEASEQVRDCHCTYYAAFLEQRERDLKGGNLLRALAEIRAEIDNLRLMWQRAVSQRMEQEIEKSIDSLALFYHLRSWYQEGEDVFRAVTDALHAERSVNLGRALMWRGNFLASRHACASQLLQEGASVLREVNGYGQTALPLWLLSELSDDPAEFDDIEQFCLDNLAACRQHGDQWGVGWTLIGLGNAPLLKGAYEEARISFEEALDIFRTLGDQFGMAGAIQALGKVAEGLGAYRELRQYGEEALALARKVDDRGGVIAAQAVIGSAAYYLGDYATARQLLEQLLPSYAEVFPGDMRLITSMLGEIVLALGDQRQARRYLHEALQHSPDSRDKVWLLLPLARLYAACSETERAVELLAAQLAAPFSNRGFHTDQMNTLLAALQAGLPPEVFAAAVRRGQSADVQTLAADALREFMECEPSDEEPIPAPVRAGGPLVESLSAREQELLELVAAGWSNLEIAQELVVTVGTVKKHLNNIFGKLDVRSRTQAVARARELGLLD